MFAAAGDVAQSFQSVVAAVATIAAAAIGASAVRSKSADKATVDVLMKLLDKKDVEIDELKARLAAKPKRGTR